MAELDTLKERNVEKDMNNFLTNIRDMHPELLENEIALRIILEKYLKPSKLAVASSLLLDNNALEWIRDKQNDENTFIKDADSYLSDLVQSSGLQGNLLEYLFYGFAFILNVSMHWLETELYLRNKAETGSPEAWYALAQFYKNEKNYLGDPQYLTCLIKGYNLNNSNAVYECGCLARDIPDLISFPGFPDKTELNKRIYSLGYTGHIGAICLYMSQLTDFAPDSFIQKVYSEFEHLSAIEYLHLTSYFKVKGRKIYEKCLIKGLALDRKLFADEYCSYLLSRDINNLDTLSVFFNREIDDGNSVFAEKWILRFLQAANGTPYMKNAVSCFDKITLNDRNILHNLGEFFQYETDIENHLEKATECFLEAANLGSIADRERLRYSNPKNPCHWVDFTLQNGTETKADIRKVFKYRNRDYMVLKVVDDFHVIEYEELGEPLSIEIREIQDEKLYLSFLILYKNGRLP